MTAILDRSTELTREANALLGQKDLVNASLKYIEGLSLYPKNAVALHNLAALQISTGQPAMIMGALYQLNAAASLLKSDQYRADYALALAQSGHGRMALKYLNAHRNAFQNSAAVDSLIQQIASQMDLKRAALKSVLARKSSPLALKELNAFIEKREFDRAIAVFNKQLDHDITDARIWRLIGHAYRMSLKMQEAQSAIRAGLAMAPSDYDLHILQIEYLTFSNAQLASVACARGSLEALAPNVRLLSSSAYAYIFAKKPEEAAALYETASAEHQADIRFQLAYANALTDLDRHDEASAIAIRIAETASIDEINLASALRILNKPGSGAVLKPVFETIDANGVTYSHPSIHFIRALMHNDLGETEEALRLIEAHIESDAATDDEQANIAMVAGRPYDKAGDYDKAYKMYERGNALHASLTLKTGRVNPNSYPDRVRILTNDLVSKSSESLSDHTVASAPGSPRIVFMYSFPRSGTTLLDTILRTHSGIEVLEEPPTIRDTLLDSYFKGAPHQLGVGWRQLLETFYDTPPETLQELYYKNFARLSRSELDPDTLYVDKMPLNTTFARLIKYIFPDSKVIFPVRDPADVVTSCFCQNFLLNDAMYQFTSMERAVALYDQVMSFWVKAEEILDLDVSYVRYEELVTDLQGVVQPVIEHLGLPWEDGLVDFWKTARERKVIRTASADQVIQKLYTSSKGRWTRYSALNDGILEPLEPWRKHFGYA